jgi:hypothetical protein
MFMMTIFSPLSTVPFDLCSLRCRDIQKGNKVFLNSEKKTDNHTWTPGHQMPDTFKSTPQQLMQQYELSIYLDLI